MLPTGRDALPHQAFASDERQQASASARASSVANKPIEPMTLGNMRELGVRSLAVGSPFCAAVSLYDVGAGTLGTW